MTKLKNKVIKLETIVRGNKSYAEQWFADLLEMIDIEGRSRLLPCYDEDWTPDHLTEAQRKRLEILESRPDPPIDEILRDLPGISALVIGDESEDLSP